MPDSTSFMIIIVCLYLYCRAQLGENSQLFYFLVPGKDRDGHGKWMTRGARGEINVCVGGVCTCGGGVGGGGAPLLGCCLVSQLED